MAPKRKKYPQGILTAEEVKMYVTVKVQMSGLDVQGYAESIGVPHQTIYALMTGYVLPSKSISEKLGLEIAYRIPGADAVLSPDQLQMLVVMKMKKSGMDMDQYAKHIGVHPQTLYTIVAGIRRPSKSLIEKIGAEKVYRIVYPRTKRTRQQHYRLTPSVKTLSVSD